MISRPVVPTSDPTVCASLTSVTKTYAPGVRALDGLDLEVQCGALTALLGVNGSGKSTCLRALFGLIHPDAGVVRALGLDPIKQSATLRTRAGYLSQAQALDGEMTGAETLAFFASLYGFGGRERDRRRRAVAELFGLDDVIGRRVATYSGGQAQRLHLAVAMLPEPELLLLDEPHTGLDPEGQQSLWEVLRAYAAHGPAVVLVTHDVEGVARFATRVVLLQRGAVIGDGTPADIIQRHGGAEQSLTSAFFRLTGEHPMTPAAEAGRSRGRRRR